MSKQEIARGPKRDFFFLFSLFLSSFNFFACFVIANNNSQFWPEKLDHPNSVILTQLIKRGYLNNTNEFSSFSFDCASYKLGKRKSLPFYLQGNHASTCFEIIHSDV